MGPFTRRFVHGTVAGMAATVAMSVVMLASRQAGWLTEQAPETITRRVTRRTDSSSLQGRELDLATAILHLGFGAAAGALYRNTLGASDTGPVTSISTGALFGACVWVVAYWSVLPGLDLMPAPPEDQRRRPAVMLLAHLIYGSVLGLLLGRSRGRS
jgi:hypothetical protein